MTENNWKRIFSRIFEKELLGSKSLGNLEGLIEAGKMQISPENMRKSFHPFLGAKKVLEIGVGSGAVSFLFYSSGSFVFGIDHCESSVDICKKVMPDGVFKKKTASDSFFEKEKFDLIICNSVFQYFGSQNYCDEVIKNILPKVRGVSKLLIMDLFEEEKKEEYERLRIKELGISKKEWDQRYEDCGHLYFCSSKFKKEIESQGYDCQINSPSELFSSHREFRFDAVIAAKQ